MIKNFLLAVAVLSLALAVGCAKGGNGIGISIDVEVSPSKIDTVPVSQSVVLTATVTGTSNPAVTWTVSGTDCTGSACGTLAPVTPATTPASATYVAPPTAPSPSPYVTITATSAADNKTTGTLQLKVVKVTVVVTPTPVTVGAGLVQQFAAVANPTNAPQTFTWSVNCTNGTNCGSVSCGSNNPTCSTATSDPAVFTGGTPQSGVLVTATSTVQETTTNYGSAAVTVAASRLPAGTYAFQFSGYNNSGPVAMAGSLTSDGSGNITKGVEDVVIDGSYIQYAPVTGSYTATNNSNNAGILTLSASGGPAYTYTAALTASGIVRMVESDGNGTGSGVMQKSAATGVFNNGAQTFAFGFTGVDLSGNRVGYVGLLPMGGNGNIANGLADSNDGGTANSYSSVTGTYSQPDATNLPGLWHATLMSPALDFDFFVAGGKTQTTTEPGPLTLYAISTDSTYQALSGSMVYQVPMTYNNLAFCMSSSASCTSVSNLTGAEVENSSPVANSSNVALILGITDGTSSGTGGTGGFTGTFDQDNNGTILSVPPSSSCVSPTVCSFSNTYVASSSNTGRYVFQMLGSPNASPVVAPIPFVLYASGADRGFLLDQSSLAVMTGTMDPQPASAVGTYAASWMPGTFAAATILNSDNPGSGNPDIAPAVDNLLFTYSATNTGNLTGTENPGNVTQAGTYTMTLDSGIGAITLTEPAAAIYVFYAIDTTSLNGGNSAIADFMTIGSCTPQPCTTGTPSSIIFAQQ
jgi:hypothetical protein